jgi:hypothetical protein
MYWKFLKNLFSMSLQIKKLVLSLKTKSTIFPNFRVSIVIISFLIFSRQTLFNLKVKKSVKFDLIGDAFFKKYIYEPKNIFET